MVLYTPRKKGIDDETEVEFNNPSLNIFECGYNLLKEFFSEELNNPSKKLLFKYNNPIFNPQKNGYK